MGLGQTFTNVLDAAKVGADWAWAVLYGEIAGPVTGFFRSRGVAEPEQAAGDVFFELARGIDAFEGTEEGFRVLVFDLAYKRLLAERKYAANRRPSVLADRVLDRLQRNIDVAQTAVSDIPERIRRAFEVLTPEQRDVLSLRIVGGLSVEQTATVIHTGVGAVKTLQRRGMARIRNEIPDEVVLS